MIADMMIKHGAPTLAGIKTGNIFSLKMESDDYKTEIREANAVLRKKGLRLIPVSKSKKKMMVYLYRPDFLKRDLSAPEAEEILEEKGYPCGDVSCCIVELVKHMAADEEFPHEIGLFLGYPPSAVKGFMKSSCDGVKCIGCWKAYSNENEAKKTFEKYDHCRAVYQNEAKKGRPLESMIVDTRRRL